MGALDLDDVGTSVPPLGDADETLLTTMLCAAVINRNVVSSLAAVRAAVDGAKSDRRATAKARERVAVLEVHVGHSRRYLGAAEARALEDAAVAANPEFASALRDLLATHGDAAYALADVAALLRVAS